MTNNDIFWFINRFKLKIYESSGEQYEKLFHAVMMSRFGDEYQSVRPWGREGDGGNDGFIPAQGHYFQIYSPKPTTQKSQTEVDAVNKAKNDFEKLKNNWSGIKKYSFVLNDRYCGIPGPVQKSLSDIEETHKIPARGLSSCQLEQYFLDLGDDRKINIVQGTPITIPEWIDPRMISELLEHLSNKQSFAIIGLLDQDEPTPAFDQKIRFNNLHDRLSQVLRLAFFQVAKVNDFFDTRPGLAQYISIEVNQIYHESLKVIPDAAENASSIRFEYILNEIIFPVTKSCRPTIELKGWQHVGLVIMAKYFETCDIYEPPNTSDPA